MTMEYKIEATAGENGCATDNIESHTRRTKKAAFKLAERLLKRDEVFSVWVHEFPEPDEDFTTQWNKYKGDKTYKQYNQ